MIEQLEDFKALLNANGQLFHARIQVHAQAILLGQVGDPLANYASIDNPKTGILSAQDDVLEGRMCRGENEMLVHHSNPACNGVGWRRPLTRVATDKDFP